MKIEFIDVAKSIAIVSCEFVYMAVALKPPEGRSEARLSKVSKNGATTWFLISNGESFEFAGPNVFDLI